MKRKTVLVSNSKPQESGKKRKFQSMDVSHPKKSSTLRLENPNNKRNSINLNNKIDVNIKENNKTQYKINPNIMQSAKSNYQNETTPLNSKSVKSCGFINKSYTAQSNTYQKQLEDEIFDRKQKIIERLNRQKEMEKRLKDFTNHEKVKNIIASKAKVKKEVAQSCNSSFNGFNLNFEQKRNFLEQKLKEIETLTSTKPKINVVSSRDKNFSKKIKSPKNIKVEKAEKLDNKVVDKSEKRINSAKEKNKEKEKDKDKDSRENEKKSKIKEAIQNNSYLVHHGKQVQDKKDKEVKEVINNDQAKDKKADVTKKVAVLKNKQPFQGMKTQQI